MAFEQNAPEKVPLVPPAGQDTPADANPPGAEDNEPNKRAKRKGFRPVSLDAVNFFLSDVRGALGPYLNVFLVTEQHWSQSSVGLVTTLGGLLGLATQVPIGMLIDATRRKIWLIIFAIAVLAAGATIIYFFPFFWPVLIANTMVAVVGDVFSPAIAALTMGLYKRSNLARRMGRNAAFDHGGNVFVAVLAGGVGYYFTQSTVFLLVPLFAGLAAFALWSIPADAVDDARARGATEGTDVRRGRRIPKDQRYKPTSWKDLLKCRPLVIFGVCALLFHFANTPLLALVGQKLAKAHPDWASAMVSICIIVAQLVMIPIGILVGRTADSWGHKKLMMAAFVILPVRAVLYTVSDNTYFLISLQVLDGLAAGIFAALSPLIVADAVSGSGRYNVALSLVTTMQGIGGALSGLLVGIVIDHFGYTPAFLGLAAVAGVAAAGFIMFMPETASTLTTGDTPDKGKPPAPGAAEAVTVAG